MGRELGLAQISRMVVYLSDTGIKKTCAPNMQHGTRCHATCKTPANLRWGSVAYFSETSRARPAAEAVLWRRGPLCTTPRAHTLTWTK